jgi:hypothetical protein
MKMAAAYVAQYGIDQSGNRQLSPKRPKATFLKIMHNAIAFYQNAARDMRFEGMSIYSL